MLCVQLCITNKRMIKPRKRAPGGGRKPQGEFDRLTSLFSLRMPEDLREQIKVAAEESRRSVSQEVIKRLNDSFGVSRDKGRDPAVRAICFLIAEIADEIRWVMEAGQHWDADPFLFRAFKIGVTKLLDGLEPRGEMKSPRVDELFELADRQFRNNPRTRRVAEDTYANTKKIIKRWKIARTVGADAAANTLSHLYRSSPLRPDEIKAAWGTVPPGMDERLVKFRAAMIKTMERTWYGMEQAKRDLELSIPRKGNRKKS